MADWFSSYLPRVQKFEGFTPTAKWDRKQFSNGYGTRALYEGETIDEKEAQRRLRAELSSAENRVRSFDPTLDDNALTALVDLTYNAGDDWSRSGLGEAVKARDWGTARQKYLEYTRAQKPDGTLETLPGLVTRRSEFAPLLGSNRPEALAAELTAGKTMAAPTVVQQPQKRRDLYNAALAQQLMGTKPTTGNTFEGATSALARGIGTAYTLDHEKAQSDKKEALVKALTGAKPDDPTMAAYAELDPGEALKLEIQDRNAKAALAREDARTAAAESRADQRAQMTINAENQRARNAQELEILKSTNKERGEANNAANWGNPIQRGAFTIFTNRVTGGTRKYRGGQLIEETQGTQPPVVPGAGGVPALPVHMNSPVSLDGTLPQPQPQAAQALPVRADTPAAQPVAAASSVPPQGSPDAPPPSVPGLTYANGKYTSPLGYEYSAKFEDGSNAPEDLFMSKELFSQDPETQKALMSAAISDDKEQTKALHDASNQWKRLKPQIEVANEAIKTAAKTGWRGDVLQSLRTIGATFGLQVEGQTAAQLIDAIGLRSTPQVRQGLPGSVSNYEMQQYAKAVIGLQNTPEANYILNRMMLLQGKSTEIDQRVADEFLKDKRRVGRDPILDEGYRARLASEYEKHPVFNDKEKQILELANKGFKVADLDAFANGKKSYDDIVASRRQPGVSRDGTVPRSTDAATAAPAKQFPGAPPIGTEIDGHIYRGGDPNQESSWSVK